ncbi:Gfo/Idh/MocA family protein [Paenibacillus thermoaerophilus]|uniref:Gfo/Idh/MocA family protein n=1 Tax=Paenibacillus thermoaerophilus TaxID=1215385 RepID=A0ABW2V4P3_9BACL|nr:Gfo/Idh/MocA family oxidoreductase [Paenibacillus thermoaerophilus]
MHKVKAGLIGCGNISAAYLRNKHTFDAMEIVACADLDAERARLKAEEFGIRAATVDELLNDPEIELIINLTIPKAHAEVNLQALEAGKHVYVEKPFAVTREEAKRVLDTAARLGLRVGSAPDTFLGGGIQTAIKLIRDGWIGTPVAASAFMIGRGHEHWHPAPEFYYEAGGGPMFDMGPYYLTALVAMLGPVVRVTGSAKASYPTRTILSEPQRGKVIPVEVPTHVTGVLDFANGAAATVIMSFDAFGGTSLPRIEVYGSQGTLVVPDPNTFGGPVLIRRAGEKEFSPVPLTHGYTENLRGLGPADMAAAIRSGRPHRANGELAYHVLEAMHGFHDASAQGVHYRMTSTCESPQPMAMGLIKGELDA